MIVRGLKIIAILLAILIGLPFVAVGSAFLFLNTDRGTDWLLHQVPGLTVEGSQGDIFDRWQAKRLTWVSDPDGATEPTKVVVSQPLLHWRPACLLQFKVCIDRLHADALSVSVPPGEPSPEDAATGPIQLPEISLPIRIALADVQIGPFSFNDTEIWQRLELAASGEGYDSEIHHIKLVRADAALSARGRLTTRGDWPLNLNVAASTTLTPERQQLSLQLSGQVRDLRFSGEAQGYLPAQLEGKVQPLDSRLPLALNLKSERFAPAESVALEDWVLDLEGAILGDLAANTSLNLITPQGPVDLKANVNGRFSGSEFSADLDASVKSPQGPAELQAHVEGNPSKIALSKLDISTDAGGLTGEATVELAEVTAWQAKLQLDRFNPGYWYPPAQASLSGAVNSEGSVGGPNGLETRSDWQLSGQWREQDAETAGVVVAANNVWELKDLILSIGDNEVTGSAQYGQSVSADLELSLNALKQLLPDIAGEINGTLSVAGTVDKPQGSVDLEASGLVWQDLLIEQLGITGSLESGQNLDLTVTTQKARFNEQTLDSARITLAGTPSRHDLNIVADAFDVGIDLSASGGFRDSEAWPKVAQAQWSGELMAAQIDVRPADQTWNLQQPAEFLVGGGEPVVLGDHCWAWQEATLCAGRQRLWPDPTLDYELSNVPTSVVKPFLPPDVDWNATINGRLEIAFPASGPQGTISLNAGPGAFVLTPPENSEEEPKSIDYQELSLTADLEPEIANIALKLAGDDTGVFRADLAIDPLSEDKTMTGDFSLESFQLATVGRLIGNETLKGEIRGQGQLKGPLVDPQVTGTINLENGRLEDPSLPLPLDDLDIQVEFAGRSADVSGTLKSGDKGTGRISGSVSWAGQPDVNITLEAESLPVVYEPFAELAISPDLQIVLQDGKLAVTGEVVVPTGAITVNEIPASAVGVSTDQVIVTQEPEAQGGAIQGLSLDITVRVGTEQVTFEGFGITGDLEGTLRIRDDMETRGILQLVRGNFEKFGQQLELRRARIVFVGSLAQPYLDIEAVRRIEKENVLAGIRLTGPVSAPRTDVFAQPSMPDDRALSYLILGRAPESKGEQTRMSQVAISLGLRQASGFTRELGEKVGISDLTLEAEGSGDTASVVASGQIAEDLTVRYGVGLFEPVTTIALRYDFAKYFYVEAASGLANSLDVFYVRDF